VFCKAGIRGATAGTEGGTVGAGGGTTGAGGSATGAGGGGTIGAGGTGVCTGASRSGPMFPSGWHWRDRSSRRSRRVVGRRAGVLGAGFGTGDRHMDVEPKN